MRGLTAWSRPFFDAPPEGFTDVPLATPKPALFIATQEMLPELDALGTEMRRFTDTVEDADEAKMRALCPLLRFGPDAIVAGLVDHGGRSLDADALLQGFARKARSHGTVLVRHRVATLTRQGSDWTATTEAGDSYSAPVIVNAASQEYASAVNRKALRSQVIDLKFLEEKDGSSKIISFFAKRARGLLARYAIDNRIKRADDLKAFDRDGYRFQAGQSSADLWVFSRPQPAPAGADKE